MAYRPGLGVVFLGIIGLAVFAGLAAWMLSSKPPAEEPVTQAPADNQTAAPVKPAPPASEYDLREETVLVGGTGVSGNKDVLSPDGLHVAHVAARGSKQVVEIDGVAGAGECDRVVGSVGFSPDSRHWAYAAAAEDKVRVIVDGAPGAACFSLQLGDFAFSPDSAHFAYVYSPSGLGTAALVLDGREVARGQSMARVTFSPDSKHLACILDGTKIVLDGKEAWNAGGPATSLWFSPDSKRLACIASKGSEYFVMVDGTQSGGTFAAVHPVPPCGFSPDSQRLAVVGERVQRGEREFFVALEGIETEAGLISPEVRFSADAKHVAWTAGTRESAWVVMDGAAGKECGRIETGKDPALIFSADSSRLAYIARSRVAKLAFVVVNGVEGKHYDDVQHVAFSPDSKHVAFFAEDNLGRYLVKDGEETTIDRTNSVEGVAFSPDSKRIAWTLRDRVIVDGIEPPSYQRVGGFSFSPDSRHFAYVAREASARTVLVVDWKERGVWDDVYHAPRRHESFWSGRNVPDESSVPVWGGLDSLSVVMVRGDGAVRVRLLPVVK